LHFSSGRHREKARRLTGGELALRNDADNLEKWKLQRPKWSKLGRCNERPRVRKKVQLRAHKAKLPPFVSWCRQPKPVFGEHQPGRQSAGQLGQHTTERAHLAVCP